MLRLGLCCLFVVQPIKFRTTTASAMMKLPRVLQLQRISEICLHNAQSLLAALRYCAANGIGAFRVQSQLWPLKTHPAVGYRLDDLPSCEAIVKSLDDCRQFAQAADLRLSFHPDQFVVLNSPRDEVVDSSLLELEYQAEVAERIGADVINIHAGGAYGDKPAALERLERNLGLLSARARSRVTIENDDKLYTPTDLLPLCRRAGTPLVYDVHHHRCCGDGLTVEEATAAAVSTWNREPQFHLSSPRDGWSYPKPQFHSDYIDIADVPDCWRGLSVTIDIEAKAKELAVQRLRQQLDNRR